jgi:RNA polymerase sigma-70 factor (ECF subfamily)
MTDEEKARAFEPLFNECAPVLRGYLRNLLRLTDAEAQDVAQEAFLSVYEHMEDIDNLKAVLFKAARNKGLNLLRHRFVETGGAAVPDPAEAPEAVSPEPSQELMLMADELKTLRERRLQQLIAQLPAKTQECLRLRAQGFKYREIVEKTGLSMDSVKARLRAAKAWLKVKMAEEVEIEDGDDHES